MVRMAKRESLIIKCCGNCKHFNMLPGFEKTGTCDSVLLNRRSDVPAILVPSDDDGCWEWEEDPLNPVTIN